jgi:sulfide:quinone oxidoreductase
MDIRTLTDDLSVTGQITQDQLAQIAAQGFRAIICNRPDGEEPGQPSFAQIEQAARAAGLAARYLPVTGGDLTDDKAAGFASLLNTLPGPVLAYCRSGMRSSTLWSLAQAAQDHSTA